MSLGYIVAPGVVGDAAAAAMDEADAAIKDFAADLAKKLEDDISPIAEIDAVEDPQGEMATCRKSRPRSPCK